VNLAPERPIAVLVVVGRRDRRRVGRPESHAGHSDWIEDESLGELAERLPRSSAHGFRKVNVVQAAVLVALARPGVHQRPAVQPVENLLGGGPLGLVGVRLEPGRVGQQFDQFRLAPGRPVERGNVAIERVREGDCPRLCQRERDGRGHHRLGERRQIEHRLGGGRQAVLGVALADGDHPIGPVGAPDGRDRTRKDALGEAVRQQRGQRVVGGPRRCAAVAVARRGPLVSSCHGSWGSEHTVLTVRGRRGASNATAVPSA
jgi:hypothetical protein